MIQDPLLSTISVMELSASSLLLLLVPSMCERGEHMSGVDRADSHNFAVPVCVVGHYVRVRVRRESGNRVRKRGPSQETG